MARIAILDYGMGNLRSVEKALERVGADPLRTGDPAEAAGGDGLILPGVGAFPEAMRRIRDRGLDEAITAAVAEQKPVIGICLGMQLLFERSSELGGADGLGLLDGEVDRLEATGEKVPHIGWEPVRWTPEAEAPGVAELVAGVPADTPFYFVHSFAPRADVGSAIGLAAFGATSFAAVVARPPLFGAQFHPEKSSSAGLRMLANFGAICERAGVVT